jgi:hypothetical protein
MKNFPILLLNEERYGGVPVARHEEFENGQRVWSRDTSYFMGFEDSLPCWNSPPLNYILRFSSLASEFTPYVFKVNSNIFFNLLVSFLQGMKYHKHFSSPLSTLHIPRISSSLNW